MRRKCWVLLVALGIILVTDMQRDVPVAAATGTHDNDETEPILSPIWKPIIQQWAQEIEVVSNWYGINPDLIAAVINAESNGVATGISREGAVGLMGVMPARPGLEWRPDAEALTNPTLNLRWGVSIFSEIIRQSGGDIYAALAAYSGGWDNAERTVPQQYAANVLNDYGRAVAARHGINPDIATRWTIAIELRHGHIATEPLIFSSKPISGVRIYGEHWVYQYVDQDGRALNIKGYAVPLDLVVPLDSYNTAFGSSDAIDPQLTARMGLTDAKVDNRNPRVVLACLPSLTRLRGYSSTRWFAPTDCPDWHR